MTDSTRFNETGKTLLLLENPSHFSACVAGLSEDSLHDVLVCCLSVAAEQFCEKNNLRYLLPDDCFSDIEREKAQTESEERIQQLVKKLNNYFRESGESGFAFEVGNYHYFGLYQFFGALHYRAFFLRKAIEKTAPQAIIVPVEAEPPINKRRFPATHYTNSYYHLLANSQYSCLLQARTVTVERPRAGRAHGRGLREIGRGLRAIGGRLIRRNAYLRDQLNRMRSSLPFRLPALLNWHRRSDILLMGGAGPWKLVLSDKVLRDRVDVWHEQEEHDAEYTGQTDWFVQWFLWKDVFCGFDVTALGRWEMERIRRFSERYRGMYRSTVDRLKTFRAVVFSVAPSPDEEYLLSVAKALDIPRVCFQHGEMSLYYPGLWNDASELLYASHYFSYGDAVSADKRQAASKFGALEEAISIGSPNLDRIAENAQPNGEYILYASSKYVNNGAGFLPFRYADRSVSRAQISILNFAEELLEKNPGYRFVWKMNPELQTEQPSVPLRHVEVYSDEKTFAELLVDASAVILDRPSTTSLEVCATDLPLFVLLDRNRWHKDAESLLARRAVVAHSVDELSAFVIAYVKEGVYEADTKNREFIRQYGTHLDDRKSKDRALAELLRIADRRSQKQ